MSLQKFMEEKKNKAINTPENSHLNRRFTFREEGTDGKEIIVVIITSRNLLWVCAWSWLKSEAFMKYKKYCLLLTVLNFETLHKHFWHVSIELLINFLKIVCQYNHIFTKNFLSSRIDVKNEVCGWLVLWQVFSHLIIRWYA